MSNSYAVQVWDCLYKTVRHGKNLRAIIDHARQTPVNVVRISDIETADGVEVRFYFANRDFAHVKFADWRVALQWLRNRRSWGIERISVPSHMYLELRRLFLGTGTTMHDYGYSNPSLAAKAAATVNA